jgi:hypothetical protein
MFSRVQARTYFQLLASIRAALRPADELIARPVVVRALPSKIGLA